MTAPASRLKDFSFSRVETDEVTRMPRLALILTNNKYRLPTTSPSPFCSRRTLSQFENSLAYQLVEAVSKHGCPLLAHSIGQVPIHKLTGTTVKDLPRNRRLEITFGEKSTLSSFSLFYKAELVSCHNKFKSEVA